MITPQQIQDFYSSKDFHPVFPGKFRHFRFKREGNSWFKVLYKIHKLEDLKKAILKFQGLDIYYGSSSWLEPHKISLKNKSGRYAVADNLLLDNDLSFDVDAEEPVTLEGLELARKSTYNIFEGMKEFKRFELQYAAFSGSKGFRLVYKDNQLNLPQDPRQRIKFVENDRKIFIQQLLSNLKTRSYYKIETFFDEPITTNVMGVIRVLGTVNSNKGYLSVEIKPSDLKKPIKQILNHVPYITERRPVIPRKREMKRGDGCNKLSCPRPVLLKGVGAGLTTSFFISNKVLGIRKGFVPFLIYQKEQKYKKQVKRLQKEFKLGNLYSYQSGEKEVFISLKIMQRRQLQKLLNKSTSVSKRLFLSHGKILAPLNLLGSFKILPGSLTGDISLGHRSYVNSTESGSGWDKIEVIKARMR